MVPKSLEASIHGVAITIRKFNSRKIGMEDLVQAGTVTLSLAEQLKEFVLQRKTILICGARSTALAGLVASWYTWMALEDVVRSLQGRY